MANYLVRTNCEYSAVIEANSEEEALLLARETDESDWNEFWDKAWSGFDCEKLENA